MKFKEMNRHFILSKERSGSSLLVAMLNGSRSAQVVSEETYVLYLFPKYGNKRFWTVDDLGEFYSDFLRMHKKNLDQFFDDVEKVRGMFLTLGEGEYSYLDLCNLIALNFYPQIDKTEVGVIVDKQLEFSFLVKEVLGCFSDSRFVVLVRDPIDNIYSCFKRGLYSRSLMFQAILWREYYEQMLRFIDDSRFLFVRYEDLILEPESILKKVSSHLGFDYSIDMLSYSSRFEDLLQIQKKRVDESFFERINDFHEGLKSDLDSSKIGVGKRNLDVEELEKLELVVGGAAVKLGYSSYKEDKLGGVVLFWWRMVVSVRKVYLLKFYYFLPVSVKLLIKKVRGNRVDV